MEADRGKKKNSLSSVNDNNTSNKKLIEIHKSHILKHEKKRNSYGTKSETTYRHCRVKVSISEQEKERYTENIHLYITRHYTGNGDLTLRRRTSSVSCLCADTY